MIEIIFEPMPLIVADSFDYKVRINFSNKVLIADALLVL